MFGGNFLAAPDANGEYFMDRDPRLFEIILNWYRHGKIIRDESVFGRLNDSSVIA